MHELPHGEVRESLVIRLASGGCWLSLNKCTDLMNCRDWVACMGAAAHASSYWAIQVIGEKCEITYCVALVWYGCGSPCKVYWVPIMECGDDCNLSLAVHAGSNQ